MLNLNISSSPKPTAFTEDKLWDLIVVGGGPGGLNGALYAKRKGLDVGIIAKDIGGQLLNTTDVDNYLGYTMIEGEALSHKFHDHLKHLEVPIHQDKTVKSLQKNNQDFTLTLSDGNTLRAKTVLIATGGVPRKLGIPGEKEFSNKGVSYCTTCDAPFFKDKHVVVAGGGNSAAEAILDLAQWASKITVVHRSQWRADQVLLDKIHALDNVTIHLESQLKEVFGHNVMRGVKAYDKVNDKDFIVETDGLFIEIGNIPNSELIASLVETNDAGEVIVNPNQQTSLKGLYAAGDVTAQPHKQIIISTAEGAKAALSINQYLNNDYILKENNNV